MTLAKKLAKPGYARKNLLRMRTECIQLSQFYDKSMLDILISSIDAGVDKYTRDIKNIIDSYCCD
jgi:hypothetical protein